MSYRWMRLLTVSLVLALGATSALAGPRRNLPGFSTNVITAHDDFSAGPVPMGFTINFFGTSYSSVYVNNNGNITFDGPLLAYTPPVSLAGLGRKILAPFFADVDTRGAGSGLVTYGTDTVNGRPAFGIEYPGVGYYIFHADKLNTFEVVIIDRSDVSPGDFDLEFNYDSMQWETGDGNGGVGGLGGSSGRVGYSNGLTGAGGASLELPGSGVPGSLLAGGSNTLITHSLNTTVVGRYLFWGRGGNIVNPSTSPPGAPAATDLSLILTGLLLIAMVWSLRKRTA